MSIAIQGAPITEIPITEIPITEIPITEIPITEIPITEIPITEIPITEIPITEIPITEIPITEIGNLINCAQFPCAGATLLDAFVGDWFLPTATLGDLLRAVRALPPPNNVTFADVLVLLFSSTASVGWEEIDLERAGLQAAAGGANAVDWNADVQLTSAPLDATVTLPKGFVYDKSTPASVRVLPAGTPVAAAGADHRHGAERRRDAQVDAHRHGRNDAPRRLPDVPGAPGRPAGRHGRDRAGERLRPGAGLDHGNVRAERRGQPRADQPELALPLLRHDGGRPRLLLRSRRRRSARRSAST